LKFDSFPSDNQNVSSPLNCHILCRVYLGKASSAKMPVDVLAKAPWASTVVVTSIYAYNSPVKYDNGSSLF